MADRVLVLFGVGKGPKVPLRNGKAKLEVVGLPKSETLIVHTKGNEGIVEGTGSQHLSFPVRGDEHVQVEYIGSNRELSVHMVDG